MNDIKTYQHLITIPNYEDRFKYLQLDGAVGQVTFAFERYLNQEFYRSYEWKQIRREVIIRDSGCDLGVPGYEIHGRILIHHMNPITQEDILCHSDYLVNPDYLICVSHNTHNAIHYGNSDNLLQLLKPRTANDTCPWRK